MATCTSAGLSKLPLARLLRSTAIFHACGSEALVKAGSNAISKAVSNQERMLLAGPLLKAARATIFNQFVAGETIADARIVATQLAAHNVRCIVDHSTEELEEEHLRQHNLQAKLKLLRTLSDELCGACSFVPVKMTGLISPALLERLTHGIVHHEQSSAGGSNSGDCDAYASLPKLDEAADAAEFGKDERIDLSSAMGRLSELCEGAKSVGVPLLLDAEQTHRQPAIRLIARTLAAEFNRATGGAPPLVYDTHQAYLVGAERRIRAELAHAEANGYTLAVKLVRGAYRAGETLRDPSVLQPTKAHTDEAYDRCAALLLNAATDAIGARHLDAKDDVTKSAGALGSCGGAPKAALLLATHNRGSAFAVADALRSSGEELSHPRVHFAQILGMADDLTLSLGLSGCNAHKLVPYGSFEEILPWLLRRLEENQDALGACSIERPLLRAELARRFRSAIYL